jgi:hypothetical protein
LDNFFIFEIQKLPSLVCYEMMVMMMMVVLVMVTVMTVEVAKYFAGVE